VISAIRCGGNGTVAIFVRRWQRDPIAAGALGERIECPHADIMLAAGSGYELPCRIMSDHVGGADRATEGKLPLRPDAIRGQRGAGRRDALHLFAVLKTRRAVGLLQPGAISPDLVTRKCCDLSVGKPHRQTSFLRELRLRNPFRIAGLVDRKPDFDNPKVGVNSRLFDDFDLDAVPVTVIDGKNLW